MSGLAVSGLAGYVVAFLAGAVALGALALRWALRAPSPPAPPPPVGLEETTDPNPPPPIREEPRHDPPTPELDRERITPAPPRDPLAGVPDRELDDQFRDLHRELTADDPSPE